MVSARSSGNRRKYSKSGAYASVIGRDIEETIASGIKNEHTVYTIAEGDALFCAVVIDVDEEKKKPVGIQRIQIRPE